MKRAIPTFIVACWLATAALAVGTTAVMTVPEALKAGTEGSVTIEVTADAQGNVKDARVLESTPPGTFDAHALAAAKSRRFNATGREMKYRIVIDYKMTQD